MMITKKQIKLDLYNLRYYYSRKKEFDMAQIINDEVEKFYQKRFIDEEVAYLALHFLVSIKNDKRSL